VSAIAAGSGYAIGGLMMSLGAQIVRDLVGSDNVLVNGVAIALFALAAGLVAIPGKRLTPRAAITVGGISSIVGTALLALSTARRALPIFVAAATAGGIGFSLMYLGGLSLINASATCRSPWWRVIRALFGCIRDAGHHCSASRSDCHDVGTGPRRRSRRGRHCSP